MLKKSYSLLVKSVLLIAITAFSLLNDSSLYAQVISYIGTFNSQGVPDYLEETDDIVSASFLARIDAAVPEN
jgi:predicted PurR-regulated permease PerM